MKRSAERSEFLSDVITTAVEGGIGYWAKVSEYRWYSPSLDGGSATHEDGVANAYVTVHEREGHDMELVSESGTHVGLDDVASAIATISDPSVVLALHNDYRKRITAASRFNDAGDLDAGDCDVIVQVAVLGDVIYG